MERLFAVLRSRGPSWDDSKPLEGQADSRLRYGANHRPHRSRSREGVIHRWTLHTECARAGWATVTAVYHLRLRAIAHLRLRASLEVSRCRAVALSRSARAGA